MRGECAELRVGAGELAGSDSEARKPAAVKRAGPRCSSALASKVRLGIDQVTRNGQMGIDRLARNEQVHDLGRSLKDSVDPEVAQQLLDGHRPLASGPQRRGRLEAAPT